MNDNGQETPEFEYQNTPEVNPVDSEIQQTEQSLVASPEQVIVFPVAVPMLPVGMGVLFVQVLGNKLANA